MNFVHSSITFILKEKISTITSTFVILTFQKTEYTAWKLSKYGIISGPYFPVFGLNTEKYGPEITPYLDTHTI